MLAVVIRTLAALSLAVLICASFLAFLTASKVGSTLLEPAFYTAILEDNDSYATIHAGLVSEISQTEEMRQFQDDLGMNTDEFDELAKQVVTLPYLKSQIDGIITGVMSYLRGESEDPQLYVELAQPIVDMRRVSLDYVNRRVESVEQTHPSTAGEYTGEAQDLIVHVERGEIPPAVPSLANVPKADLKRALDDVLPVLSEINPRAASNLESHWPEVRNLALEQPESPEAMKLAARAVVSPYIDEAIVEVRAHLDDRDRFDLVEAAAEDSDMPRDQFLADADSVRDPINSLQSIGPTVALVVMAFAAIALALVNLPHRASMILWPSITLIIAGILAIIVSALLTAAFSNVSFEACADATDFACEPVMDILRELTRAMADFPILPSVALIILGGLGAAVAAIIIIIADFRGTGTGPSRPAKKPKEGW